MVTESHQFSVGANLKSTLARSKAVLEKEGWHFQITERWNSFAKQRQDFGGFGDALCWCAGQKVVLAINSTTNSHLSGHLKKYKELPKLKDWLLAGQRFEIHCWAKMGARGERKLWKLKRVPVTLDMFDSNYLDTEPSEKKEILSLTSGPNFI